MIILEFDRGEIFLCHERANRRDFAYVRLSSLVTAALALDGGNVLACAFLYVEAFTFLLIRPLGTLDELFDTGRFDDSTFDGFSQVFGQNLIDQLPG